jgi:hypothetical protein
LLAQIEGKLLQLAKRDLDHATMLAEGLVEDFQHKLDFLETFWLPQRQRQRRTLALIGQQARQAMTSHLEILQ